TMAARPMTTTPCACSWPSFREPWYAKIVRGKCIAPARDLTCGQFTDSQATQVRPSTRRPCRNRPATADRGCSGPVTSGVKVALHFLGRQTWVRILILRQPGPIFSRLQRYLASVSVELKHENMHGIGTTVPCSHQRQRPTHKSAHN